MGENWIPGVSIGTVAWVVGWVVVSCGAPSAEVEPADLVLHGGRVVTVAKDESEAEAIAVKDAWIVAVGSSEEIEVYIGPETRVIDLEGRLAIPGFIEGHGHFLGLGHSMTILDLSKAANWEEIVDMVEEAVAINEPGTWIVGRGWHQEKWSRPPSPSVDGSPVHDSLSAVSPENPVLLGHASGHAAFANRLAMDLAGLDQTSQSPSGGELVRDSDGRLTGLLRETAQGPVRAASEAAMKELTPEDRLAQMRGWVDLAGREALEKGITSFHDAGASFEVIDFFRELEQSGELPIRLYVMVRHQSNQEMEEHLPASRMLADGNDFLAVRSIKRQIDGALGAHGAWLLEAYSDLPESIGLVLEPEDEIEETARIAIQHGFQVNTHAIGDRANRRVLDIYQGVFEKNGNPSDLRWRIEHAQHLHPDDVDRFARLGVIAAMQGIHCTSDGPWVLKRLGSERAESGAYLWRRLWDSGAVVTNGTDVPVEDIDPIASFHASVSRQLPNGEVFYPAQRMSRLEALQSYTLNNAFAAFEETLKGSIEVGKLADIVVLSGDILRQPVEEILDTRVDFTIVGGEVRFQRQN